jgi:HEAT repeat protein
VALIQIGSEGALDHLERMTEHTAAEFRATAAWAIGHLQQADLLPRIKMLLQDKDPLVFRNALRASVKLRKDRKEAAPGQAW